MYLTREGISTGIGKLHGKVAWSKIADVEDVDRHLLIVGSSGNAFFIPDRAFSSSDQKTQLISDIGRWRRGEQ
jgi:hypothetical protein